MIWMSRFQLRTAASRAHSSGAEMRCTGSREAMPMPASAHDFLSAVSSALSARG